MSETFYLQETEADIPEYLRNYFEVVEAESNPKIFLKKSLFQPQIKQKTRNPG